jgi:pyruvate dehydrogenase E2 component (dihydrolipoyllysine-residue acetyltransferase)
MPIPILMPALSPTMETGTLAKWLVKEGDTIASGDVLAEIETDKATMEVESIDEGRIARILVSEGTEEVPVNQMIAVLLEDGEDDNALDGFSAGGAAAPTPSIKAESPVAETSPAASPEPVTQKTTPAQGATKVFASPLAKRLAHQNNLDLARISGSGPNGRIVKRDIEAALAGGGAIISAAPAPSAAVLAAGPSDQAILALYEEGTYDIMPHDGMRKIIAQRLQESKQSVPHFYLTLDCELDALLDLRKIMNARSPKEGAGAYKISVNDFIIKAMAMALQRVPAANATWTEAGMLLHKYSDVGVAVAIEGGLFTPVIRQAETKGLAQISVEMKDLAGRARQRKLAPHEYQGGTTAISNLGMFGISHFSAVINPPQATILAVGAGAQRMVVKDGAPVVATVMTVTLSCDHRAVDGALGANLLGEFKAFIEEPGMMLV